jgi:glycosyltransferase involved in cell wall biosynthesis
MTSIMTKPNHVKILLINDHIYLSGGGDATFWYERKIYEDAGYEVYTFSHSTKHDAAASGKDIVHIETSNRIIQKIGKFTFNFKVYWLLRRTLKEINPSFVHLHLPSKYPASIYAALVGYPVVQTLHGPNLFCATGWGCLKRNSGYCELGTGIKCYLRGCLAFWRLPLVFCLYIVSRAIAKKAVTLFIGPSRQICEAAQRFGFEPVEYFPICVDEVFCSELNADTERPPVIIYVGAMAEVKGVHILLEAFRKVIRQVPQARLIYAGSGDLLDLLKRKAIQYGLEKSVEFLGFVEHDNIYQVYTKGRVFIMPSIWSEQFGLAGPEALMCGLPCVASNVGGIPEWLKDGQWGYLVPPGDSEALAEKIILLLEDPRLCKIFADRGREFILRQYGTEKFKRNILNLADRFVKRSYSNT